MSSSSVALAPVSRSNPASRSASLLVCVPTSSSAEGVQKLRARVTAMLPGINLLFAAPEGLLTADAQGTVALPVPSHTHPAWVLPASDYAAAADLSRQHGADATLILGSDVDILPDEAVRALSDALLRDDADVVFPRYTLHPHEGLISAALLYPVTRTLFGAPVHLPLPPDIGFSARAAERLGAAARRQSNSANSEAFLWPAAESSFSNLRVHEVAAGPHTVPAPATFDLNTLLSEVLGSAFADIENKAAFWQRARVPAPAPEQTPTAPAANGDLDEITPLVDSFRNAFTNLQQIWALVLPPHSLLALKKLSLTPAEQFRMPASLWARTVYEFVLAFHLRTLNRGHLLGAFTPLYLAWVASFLGQVSDDAGSAAEFVEHNAAVFDAEKPYLVSRWRWPDRFNP